MKQDAPAMFANLRNAGRPGIGAMAMSAVDIALWDLRARLLERPPEKCAAGRPKPSVRRRLAGLAALAMTVGAARVSAQPSSRRADTCQSCVTCDALHTRRRH